MTLRWREMDSNHRYRMRNNPFWLPLFGPRNSPSATKTGCFVPGTDVTEAGEVYFKRCQSIVEEARIAHESLLYVVERPTGTLRVSMPADLATDHLAPIIADFAKTYPLIAFEFDLSPRHVDLQT